MKRRLAGVVVAGLVAVGVSVIPVSSASAAPYGCQTMVIAGTTPGGYAICRFGTGSHRVRIRCHTAGVIDLRTSYYGPWRTSGSFAQPSLRYCPSGKHVGTVSHETRA